MKKKKIALRQEMRAIRHNIAAQGEARPKANTAVQLIASNILMLPEIAGEVQRGIRAKKGEPHIVAGFYPIQTEIDCLYIMKALNAIQCRCALPIMNGQKQHLAFKEWDLVEELVEGPFGTREPPSDLIYVMPDIILVPFLAFDEKGYRLGYGGGYYDRTLEAYRKKGHDFIAIGIGYEGQKIDGVPKEVHDQPLDIIVTEQKVYRP